jgi:hypothetical protein
MNLLFQSFDELVEAHGLWKADTIGDAYVVVGGLFRGTSDFHQTDGDENSEGGDDGSCLSEEEFHAREAEVERSSVFVEFGGKKASQSHESSNGIVATVDSIAPGLSTHRIPPPQTLPVSSEPGAPRTVSFLVCSRAEIRHARSNSDGCDQSSQVPPPPSSLLESEDTVTGGSDAQTARYNSAVPPVHAQCCNSEGAGAYAIAQSSKLVSSEPLQLASVGLDAVTGARYTEKSAVSPESPPRSGTAHLAASVGARIRTPLAPRQHIAQHQLSPHSEGDLSTDRRPLGPAASAGITRILSAYTVGSTTAAGSASGAGTPGFAADIRRVQASRLAQVCSHRSCFVVFARFARSCCCGSICERFRPLVAALPLVALDTDRLAVSFQEARIQARRLLANCDLEAAASNFLRRLLVRSEWVPKTPWQAFRRLLRAPR